MLPGVDIPLQSFLRLADIDPSLIPNISCVYMVPHGASGDGTSGDVNTIGLDVILAREKSCVRENAAQWKLLYITSNDLVKLNTHISDKSAMSLQGICPGGTSQDVQSSTLHN